MRSQESPDQFSAWLSLNWNNLVTDQRPSHQIQEAFSKADGFLSLLWKQEGENTSIQTTDRHNHEEMETRPREHDLMLFPLSSLKMAYIDSLWLKKKKKNILYHMHTWAPFSLTFLRLLKLPKYWNGTNQESENCFLSPNTSCPSCSH